ncbi:MAG TPA: cupin domain-containing protein [Solirubrobacteraceae bacterium]|nr:cupin domain-containing protein [Solirubrobacteraceae bacterium]
MTRATRRTPATTRATTAATTRATTAATTPEPAAAAARCVPDLAAFAREHWGRAPGLWPGVDPAGYRDLLGIDDVDALIAGAGLRFPAVKVVRGGRKIGAGEYTAGATIGGVRVDDLVDPEAVRAAFAGGATIVLSSLHRYWPPLERFCRALEEALSHPVQVNAYVTPAGARGLDLHWDTHDVFVLQCFGEKHWRVHGEGFRAPLRHQHRSGAIAAEGEALIETVLRPGDCLYVPRGFVHGAETDAAASAHLTIGVLTHSWVDVLRGVLGAMEDSPELREALPVGFADDPAAVAELAREKLGVLADLVAQADGEALVARVAERAGRRLPPRVEGQIASIARLGRLSDASVLRSAQAWRLDARDGRVTVATGTRVLRLPARVEPALRLIARGEPFALGDLAPWLDQAGRTTLATRLVREGLLEDGRRG